jgi:hypothetical protein
LNLVPLLSVLYPAAYERLALGWIRLPRTPSSYFSFASSLFGFVCVHVLLPVGSFFLRVDSFFLTDLAC